MKRLSLAAAIAATIALAAPAAAITATGTFTIDIYNIDPATKATSYANAAGVDAAKTAGEYVDTVTWTGELDFWFTTGQTSTTPPQTIGEFFRQGDPAGVLSGVDVDLDSYTLSSKGFSVATLFDITGSSDLAFSGKITHDDGITFYDDGVDTGSFAGPTSKRTTDFSFDGGDWRLVYASANGNPSILSVDITRGTPYITGEVPLPAGVWLMGTALAGLGLARRKRKAA